jgi:hypothetical protein
MATSPCNKLEYTMKIGDYINVSIYGRRIRVRVLKIHAFGTVDVQRADGACFRVSGLSI